MTDTRTLRGFKGTDPRPAICEKLPFSAWELAAMENALRYYANHYNINSDITRRQVIKLANRLGDANPKRKG